MKPFKLFISTLIVLSLFAANLAAQSGRKRTEPKAGSKTEQKTESGGAVEGISETKTAPGGETIEGDVLQFNTSLVTVPVTVLDRNGGYVPQLQRSEFHIFENGVEQKIAYFATTRSPFTVVLLIDTSGSTQFRLDEIQNAAINFVGKLKPEDSVMVISFDERIDLHTKVATTDRAAITKAIRRTSTGGGTRLYDAVDAVLRQHLRTISGRKAVVLFTDGLDTASRRASYDSTVRLAEESDAPIYSVDYDTSGGTVFGQRRPTIFGLPLPQPGSTNGGATPADYRRATSYLHALSNNTGGRFYSGDSMFGIAQAFTWIAEELGRQYSLGYYPQTTSGNGQRRQIKVKVDEPNTVVKARDSYIYTDKRSAGPIDKDKPSEKQPYGSDSRNYFITKAFED